MKSLFFVALATLFSISLMGESNLIDLLDTTTEISEKEVVGGSIVMEDAIMLLTNSGNSSEDVIQIDITTTGGTLIEKIEGCNASSCTTDLGHLQTGNYEVHVTTSANNTFSDTVYVQSGN